MPAACSYKTRTRNEKFRRKKQILLFVGREWTIEDIVNCVGRFYSKHCSILISMPIEFYADFQSFLSAALWMSITSSSILSKLETILFTGNSWALLQARYIHHSCPLFGLKTCNEIQINRVLSSTMGIVLKTRRKCCAAPKCGLFDLSQRNQRFFLWNFSRALCVYGRKKNYE